MFETFSLLTLQQYWWIIISLLGAILVFLLFVQGGQSLIYTLGKTENEKTIIINSIGRKWEFTFTTLVTFGGAFFASFPLFYSTSFGGAYWVWMIILFSFVLQAVSYEFRKKSNNFLGQKTFEVFLMINGFTAPLLLGITVATFFTGSNFSVDEMNFSKWENTAHGLESVLSLHNLSLGIAVFSLSRVLAILYFMNNINNENIFSRSKKQLFICSSIFLISFLSFIITLMFVDGYAVNPDTKEVFKENYKYFNNFLEMPINIFIFLSGVLLVLFGIFKSLFKKSDNGIWFAGAGTVLTVFSLFILSAFNNTSFYPSNFDLQSSLTIENSSSSHYTLTIMSYVSLFIPFVIWYIFYTWKAINKTKIDIKEIKEKEHFY